MNYEKYISKDDKYEFDISVVMVTYFQEKYVRKAIESILMQETSCSYEIIISDDCSEDGTVDIIREYERKYPEKIKVKVNARNLGIPKNVYSAECMATGKYMTFMSGDDYYIDKYRFQKQYEFLEKHKEFFGVTTNVEQRYEYDDKPFEVLPPKKYRGKAVTLEKYLNGANMGTHGLMMRNIFVTLEGRNYFLFMVKASKTIDDTSSPLLMLNLGPIYSMDFNSVARRVLLGGDKHNFNSIYKPITSFHDHIVSYNYVNENFPKKLDLYHTYEKLCIGAFTYCMKRGMHKKYKELYVLVPGEYKGRGLRRNVVLKSVSGFFIRRAKMVIKKAVNHDLGAV